MTVSGQHEEVLVVRADGAMERIDTLNLGFPLGLKQDISRFVGDAQVPLRIAPVVGTQAWCCKQCVVVESGGKLVVDRKNS